MSEFFNYLVVLATFGNHGDIHRATNFTFLHRSAPNIGDIVTYQALKRGILTLKEIKAINHGRK